MAKLRLLWALAKMMNRIRAMKRTPGMLHRISVPIQFHTETFLFLPLFSVRAIVRKLLSRGQAGAAPFA